MDPSQTFSIIRCHISKMPFQSLSALFFFSFLLLFFSPSLTRAQNWSFFREREREMISYLLIITYLLKYSFSNSTSCYYPNGAGANDDHICDSSSHFSTCCGSVWTCLPNRTCQYDRDDGLYPVGQTIPGSCTDETWKAPECYPYCRGTSNTSW